MSKKNLYNQIAEATGVAREDVKKVLLAAGYSQTVPELTHDLNKLVVQPWMAALTMKQQTVVLSALRGCDGKSKNDQSKALTRRFRSAFLRDAAAGSGNETFMRHDGAGTEYVHDWVQDLDHYPVHWLMHFAHACQIVGEYHPDNYHKEFWAFVYRRIIDALHLQPEELMDMEIRLMDTV